MTTMNPNDRKQDEAQQVDETGTRGRDKADQRHVDTPGLAKHDRVQRDEEPDARAEKAREPETRNAGAENQAPVAARTRLFEDTEAEQYRVQWRELQSNFVDEPRAAVREAETLVSQMMESLTTQLNEQKRALAGGSGTDTEQLRVTMQRYRSLFDQMLQV